MPTKASTITGPTTKVKPCTCVHDFQDRTYGRGQRVHNKTAKGYRCTACGRDGS